MSKHHHPPAEGPSAGLSPGSEKQGRGYFFYIALFFILIALLCFILNGASLNGWPTVPAPVTSTSSN